MLRKLVLAAALVATSAFAQQNTDISGVDFNSGAADAALAELGRAAAVSGKRLVITAPSHWHARIAAKVRAGGDAAVILRDGFYENVLVRVDEAPSSDAAAAPSPASTQAEVERSRADAERAKADAARSRAEAEKAKAEAERVRAEADKARAEADLARLRAQQAAAAAAAAAAPAPATAASTLTALPAEPAALPQAADEDAELEVARARLEQTLVGGRKAEGTMSVAALESGDQIYVDGPARGVIRRDGLRPVLYWLDGELDVRRAELKVLGNDRYQVLGAIRGDSGPLRGEFDQAPPLVAQEPAADSPARLALEQSLNGGRTIAERLPVAKLRAGDQVFVGEGVAVVVRREGDGLRRYWLDGTLDVRQAGVRADGSNKYRVLSDRVQ